MQNLTRKMKKSEIQYSIAKKMLAMFGWNFEFEERCNGVDCVDLDESFPFQRIFTWWNRRRYSRERAPRSLGENSTHYSFACLGVAPRRHGQTCGGAPGERGSRAARAAAAALAAAFLVARRAAVPFRYVALLLGGDRAELRTVCWAENKGYEYQWYPVSVFGLVLGCIEAKFCK